MEPVEYGASSTLGRDEEETLCRKIARISMWTSQGAQKTNNTTILTVLLVGAASQVDPAECLLLLTEDDKEAKRCAIKALEQHPGSIALEPLGQMLDDGDAGIRTAAIGSLGKFGKEAAPFAAKLIQMSTEDEDARVKARLGAGVAR